MGKDAAKRMQNCLNQLGIRLTVRLCPEPNTNTHGEIKQGVLLIYDEDEQDAWDTFTHEVFEFRFQQVTQPYRMLVNSLIEVIEKLTYTRKEEFLDFLPKLTQSIQKAKTTGLKNDKRL